MRLSVIIPTCGNPDSLLRVLDSLANVGAPATDDYEVIVVRDLVYHGAEAVQQAVLEHAAQDGWRLPAHLQWLHTARRGAATARNAGIRVAQGRRLLFLDDDCVAPPGLLALHAARGDGDALIGFRGHVARWQHAADIRTLPVVPDARWKRLGQVEAECRANTAHVYNWVVTCHLSVPTDAARAVGGFWEEMQGSGWEDLEFGLRLQRHGTCFSVLRQPWVWHLDHPLRRRTEYAAYNKQLFTRTKSDPSIVVRNRVPIGQ